jgi:hypothetical protein
MLINSQYKGQKQIAYKVLEAIYIMSFNKIPVGSARKLVISQAAQGK